MTTKTHCNSINEINLIGKYTRPSFALSQVLTGHGYHRAYLHRSKISDTDVCPCDNFSVQTLKHLIQECPRWNNTILDLTIACSNFGINPYKIIDVIKKESSLELYLIHINNIILNLKKFNN